jgi:tRNA(Ile)-lysidine synthase
VASVLGLKDGKERALPGGPTLVREKGWIRVKGKRAAPRPFRLSWNGEERLDVAGAGMEFEGSRRKPAERAASRKGDLETAVLDASKLAFPLVVRNRRPGDLYRPLGAPGRKKLKEILRAKGVPREERDRLPVFCSGGEIVWVPGLPVAEKFKVTPKTKTVFVIEKK